MIAVVWLASLVISIAPIFGWKDPEFYNRVLNEKKCLVSQDALYQIFATSSSFYVPLFLILLLYWKIFKVARQRIRHKPGKNQKHPVEKSHKEKKAEKKPHNNASKDNGQQKVQQQQLYTSSSPAVLIIQKAKRVE
ncbi:serotonin receptor-like [Tropilaelaps mercedesae]|uniref:Serotonin receptor-like n=1 Tax=Tropilaelaps mercedesae TaxID=418985 RepID=A0A1V9XF51_9ACAR|nr:serotonin receptor-like [Tropilaelaps mercedesae]